MLGEKLTCGAREPVLHSDICRERHPSDHPSLKAHSRAVPTWGWCLIQMLTRGAHKAGLPRSSCGGRYPSMYSLEIGSRLALGLCPYGNGAC